jgi:hypothetical protein
MTETIRLTLGSLASVPAHPWARLSSRGGPPTWAEIATACIAFLALVGAIIQLASARRASLRRTAFAYFERYSDPSAVPYIAEMLRLLAKSKPSEDDDARWRSWKKKHLQTRLRCLVFVNFWEELGGLYNRGLIDRGVICRYLGKLIVTEWVEGQWFIERCQDQEPQAFRDWEKMASHIGRWLEARDESKRWRRRWKLIWLRVR